MRSQLAELAHRAARHAKTARVLALFFSSSVSRTRSRVVWGHHGVQQRDWRSEAEGEREGEREEKRETKEKELNHNVRYVLHLEPILFPLRRFRFVDDDDEEEEEEEEDLDFRRTREASDCVAERTRGTKSSCNESESKALAIPALYAGRRNVGCLR